MNVIDKTENNIQSKNQNVYFLMYICNYEAKSDTEAVFSIQSSLPWFTAWNQFYTFACKQYFKYIFCLFSMSCIKRCIRMDRHKNVRFLI